MILRNFLSIFLPIPDDLDYVLRARGSETRVTRRKNLKFAVVIQWHVVCVLNLNMQQKLLHHFLKITFSSVIIA